MLLRNTLRFNNKSAALFKKNGILQALSFYNKIMQNIDQLKTAFADKKQLSFHELGDHTAVRIENNEATCELTLFGAHILSFTPLNSKDLLWMSPGAVFIKELPIRGGIPLCFPWFGPHNTDKTKKAHGFARNIEWTLKEVNESDNLTIVTLVLQSSESTKTNWPFDFTAEYKIEISSTLKASFKVTNTGSDSLRYSLGLHTYFNVGDIDQILITGFKDKCYYQAFDPNLIKQTEADLVIKEEENRRYLNCCKGAIIKDKVLGRSIIADKEGSRVTVVWNPHAKDCKNFKDIPDDGYKNFICIEATNTYDNIIELHNGHSHTTAVILSEIIE